MAIGKVGRILGPPELFSFSQEWELSIPALLPNTANFLSISVLNWDQRSFSAPLQAAEFCLLRYKIMSQRVLGFSVFFSHIPVVVDLFLAEWWMVCFFPFIVSLADNRFVDTLSPEVLVGGEGWL